MILCVNMISTSRLQEIDNIDNIIGPILQDKVYEKKDEIIPVSRI